MNRICRLISWILAAVLLCLSLSGALAEENAYSVLTAWLAALEQDPAEGVPLSGADSVNACCLRMINHLDRENVRRVFYGSSDEASALILQLKETLYGDAACTDYHLENASTFYVCVWALLHADSPSQEKSRPAVKEKMKGIYEGGAEDVISAAVDLCFDYIGKYEPDLAAAGYTMNSQAQQIGGSDGYVENFRQASRLFDEGKYREAIEKYRLSLTYREDDAAARLEIAEAYIAMRDYDQAKQWLEEVTPYLSSDSERARWLRRQGFIAIEEMDFELAYALYVYSLEYEDSQLARQELAYIEYAAPAVRHFTAEEALSYLQSNGVAAAK